MVKLKLAASACCWTGGMVVMVKGKKKAGIIAGILFFILYFFTAVRPIPRETILVSQWLSSLESAPVAEAAAGAENSGAPAGAVLPFRLGSRFGYVDAQGRFLINRAPKGEVFFSADLWADIEAEPERIEIRNWLDEPVLAIENPRSYPGFLDGRVFLVNSEQNALSEVDAEGKIKWTYEFAAPLTCIDAAAGLVLTGSVDGAVEVLDNAGKRVFFFEPGGSRRSVILGCAISRDGSRLGIVSGLDNQRFLLLERFGGSGGEYKVIYHEFLEQGFRRAVHIAFIDQDRWIVFEREGGVGVYEIGSRQGATIPLNGEIAAIDTAGGGGLFFVISSLPGERKELVGVRLPGRIVMRAPFKSGGVFLGRTGSRLFVGGGSTLASFELEKK
jgi:hypothetical protein